LFIGGLSFNKPLVHMVREHLRCSTGGRVPLLASNDLIARAGAFGAGGFIKRYILAKPEEPKRRECEC
jgi:hypothetical protein